MASKFVVIENEHVYDIVFTNENDLSKMETRVHANSPVEALARVATNFNLSDFVNVSITKLDNR